MVDLQWFGVHGIIPRRHSNTLLLQSIRSSLSYSVVCIRNHYLFMMSHSYSQLPTLAVALAGLDLLASREQDFERSCGFLWIGASSFGLMHSVTRFEDNALFVDLQTLSTVQYQLDAYLILTQSKLVE